jgi:hypothetical protein
MSDSLDMFKKKKIKKVKLPKMKVPKLKALKSIKVRKEEPIKDFMAKRNKKKKQDSFF